MISGLVIAYLQNLFPQQKVKLPFYRRRDKSTSSKRKIEFLVFPLMLILAISENVNKNKLMETRLMLICKTCGPRVATRESLPLKDTT